MSDFYYAPQDSSVLTPEQREQLAREDTQKQETLQKEEAAKQDALKQEELKKEQMALEQAKQEDALQETLARKGFDREDVYVFVDDKGKRLLNAEKFAETAFQAEDATRC